MAIQFNPQALSAFAKFNVGNNDAIANVGEGGNLVHKKELGSVFLRMFRMPGTKERNNAVRTELLKALGQAFNIDGATTVQGGKTRFSDGFMRTLEEIIGPEAFKRDDFGLEGGEVASGKPLTLRRIKAIIKAACAKGETDVYDGNIYLAKVDAITDFFRTERPQDAQSTTLALEYFGNLRRTIEFLESDMAGLMQASKVEDFVYDNTGMCVDVEKFNEEVEGCRASDKPMQFNIDDLDKVRNDQMVLIKAYVKQRLEALVKLSVDSFAEARKNKDVEGFVEVLFISEKHVDDILTGLEKYNRNLHGDEIVENNFKSEKIEIKDDSEKIVINDEPKPEKIVIKDEPEEEIKIKEEPKKIEIKDEFKEEIEVKNEPVKNEINDELEDKKEAGGGSEVDDDSENSDDYNEDDYDYDDDRQIFLQKEARVVIKKGIKNEVNIDIDTDEKPVALDDSVIESTYYKMSDGIAGRIKSLPADTQRKFKVFFYSTVRDLEAKAVRASKLADFGDTIEKLLSSINSRKEPVRGLLVELLAERKLKIFGKDDQLLPQDEINAQVGNVCGLIDAIEAYCTKDESGDVAADIAHKTVMAKIAQDGKIGEAREFPAPGKGEIDELLKAADKFDVDFTFTYPETQKQVTDILCEAMRAASRKFETKLRKEGDSDLTAAVKKNIFKAFAVTRFISKIAPSVAFGVNNNYAGLMLDKEAGKILKFIAPAYECKTKRKLNGELVNGR